MTSRPRRVIVDEELLELFADDAEALAVIDAITSTQSKAPRRRVGGRGVALLAAAIVAAVVALVVGGSSRAGVIDQAIAAFPVDRVIHLSLRYEDQSQVLLDLGTGRRTPIIHRFDEWYDARARVRRFKDTVAGVPVTDVRLRAEGEDGFTSLALTRFPQLYRRGLAEVSDSDVHAGIAGGRDVYWISFRRSLITRVAIDRKTFRPIIAVVGHGDVRRFAITEVITSGDGVPQAKPVSDLRIHPPRYLAAGRDAAMRGSRAYAALAPEFHGLHAVTLKTLVFGSDEGYDLLFSTGPRQRLGRFVQVQESHIPEPTFGWTRERVVLTKKGVALVDKQGDYEVVFARIGTRAFRIVARATSHLALAAVRQVADKST